MMQEKVTLLQLLETGFHVDAEALDGALRQALTAELKTDLSAARAPQLNDPAVALKVVEANALIGIVPKDSNRDGIIDLRRFDKVGVSCAICHTTTDGSVGELAGKGSIGRRLDGRATYSLDMGKALAMAATRGPTTQTCSSSWAARRSARRRAAFAGIRPKPRLTPT